MLLILAGVSLSSVFGEKGIFKRAESAGEKYNEAKARETLETVLLADGQYEKNTNPNYDEVDTVNELIKSGIPGADVKGDVAIIGGQYAYELDRSVPKIGRYLGLKKDLVWPEVEATVRLAEDKKNATITITASEEKNGINKIEIWLLGEMIKEYTYDPTKSEATENYIATQNGEYTIKAYGDLMASKTVTVDGIVASVKFEPNGNEEWKKEHSTVVTIQETADKVVSAKYVWLASITTPDDSEFPEEQTFTSGDTIIGGNETMTGTYYLWIMLTTKSGEKVKWRSDGFNFDNEGPNIISFSSKPETLTSFTLTGEAEDANSEIASYEFYVENENKKLIESNKKIEDYTFDIKRTADKISCQLKVTDICGNETITEIDSRTLLYLWTRKAVTKEAGYYWGPIIKHTTGSWSFQNNQNAVVGGYYVATYPGDPSTGKVNEDGITEISRRVGAYYVGNIFGYCKALYKVTGYKKNPWDDDYHSQYDSWTYTIVAEIEYRAAEYGNEEAFYTAVPNYCSPGSAKDGYMYVSVTQRMIHFLVGHDLDKPIQGTDAKVLVESFEPNYFPENGAQNCLWYVKRK